MGDKIIERIIERVLSCYLDLKLARNVSCCPIYIEGFRCRLDELLLLYSNSMNISFIEACSELEVKYRDVNGGTSSSNLKIKNNINPIKQTYQDRNGDELGVDFKCSGESTDVRMDDLSLHKIDKKYEDG